MKLSVSNISWNKEKDTEIYKELVKYGYSGVEIAPTIFIQENPYDNLKAAKLKAEKIKREYGLEISSMQSIWYKKIGNIFNKKDAEMFINYTKKAIDFASCIDCKNLVFGCPKNRNLLPNSLEDDVIYFFKEIGNYAKSKNTIISIEPISSSYGTNFINTTYHAFDFVKKIENEAIKVNIDFGTIISNSESLEDVFKNINLVNHIHISEPQMKTIKKRKEHVLLSDFLKKVNYSKYVSVEMNQTENIQNLKETIKYISKVFG